ncbi:unnamed protein product [Soboliphyme baturini]|uniref:Uncharacterized protein n=1 Tax=Soboliphyme baturini TaxID=241478 RepID=A0A183IWI5_9BILA|nr:unnamed protein product [Soboliphyme baturini]
MFLAASKHLRRKEEGPDVREAELTHDVSTAAFAHQPKSGDSSKQSEANGTASTVNFNFRDAMEMDSTTLKNSESGSGSGTSKVTSADWTSGLFSK